MSQVPLTQLGNKVVPADSPEFAVLERIELTEKNRYVIGTLCRFTCPEFTSKCPVTGQPDFARFVIDYIPRYALLESKSLKLFLASFRNHGAFHEECTAMIGRRIYDTIQPFYLRIVGIWEPRGGIPIDVVWTDGEPNPRSEVPPIESILPIYQGR